MYTHTFEFELDGILLEGEVTFGDKVDVKWATAPELTLAQLERINMVFRSIQ